jgi:hypothetical protein
MAHNAPFAKTSFTWIFQLKISLVLIVHYRIAQIVQTVLSASAAKVTFTWISLPITSLAFHALT